MIERFLKQTKFTSEQDFKEHLEFIIPEDFNFAYDVMDEWAKIKPDHVALLWTSERGEEIRFTYKFNVFNQSVTEARTKKSDLSLIP